MKPIPLDLRHDAPAVPPIEHVEHDYEAYARNSAEVIRLADEEDRLRAKMEATEQALIEAEEMLEAARFALTCSILKAAAPDLPGINRWHRMTGPLCQVRSGNRVLALVPAKDSDIPMTADELPGRVSLAIIDLES